MQITVTVPRDLEDLIKDALDSGEYDSVEQIVTDALYFWAEAIDEYDEDEEGDDDEDLLEAMQGGKDE